MAHKVACALLLTCCIHLLSRLGGSRNIRRIWRVYAPEVHGIVYVVDAADPGRFSESREALHQLLSTKQLSGKPLLVLANKQDQSSAQPSAAVASALGLECIQQERPCTISPCTAKEAGSCQPGFLASKQQLASDLKQAFQWLSSSIQPIYSQLQLQIDRDSAEAHAAERQRKQERAERARLNKLHQDTQAAGQVPDTLLQQQHRHGSAQPHSRQDTLKPCRASEIPEALLHEHAASGEPVALHAATSLPCSRTTAGQAVMVAAGNNPQTPQQAGTSCLAETEPATCTDSPDATATVTYTAPPNSSPLFPVHSRASGSPGVGLVQVLQAALPGTVSLTEFSDLKQAVHDVCGPTPRQHSISSEASSILQAAQHRPLVFDSAWI